MRVYHDTDEKGHTIAASSGSTDGAVLLEVHNTEYDDNDDPQDVLCVVRLSAYDAECLAEDLRKLTRGR